jgi:hypothetical protein
MPMTSKAKKYESIGVLVFLLSKSIKAKNSGRSRGVLKNAGIILEWLKYWSQFVLQAAGITRAAGPMKQGKTAGKYRQL